MSTPGAATLHLPHLPEVADVIGRLGGLATLGVVVAAGLLLGVLRVIAVRGAVRNRVRWAALPGDEFDPEVEDVSRFAFQVARSRRAFRGWLERPGSAVRIRLRSVPEGRMLYELEGPGHGRSVLRAAAYDHVELRDLETLELPGLRAVDPSTADASSQARADERTRSEHAAAAVDPLDADDPLAGLELDREPEDRR